MGHANLSNLSDLFVNLLYAKGRLSIDDAVTAAVKRKEAVRASEGPHADEGTLATAFNDVVAHLTDPTGRGYFHNGPWEGPWVEPEFLKYAFSYNANRIPESDTVTNLLRQCSVAYVQRAFGNVLPDEALFGVCADAIQDLGDDAWALRVRSFPRQYWVWRMRALKKWDVFDEEVNWKAFDSTKWVFCAGWRRRYKEIPRLSDVTH